MNWNNRGDRLARMRERDEFSKYFMPRAYAVGLVGLGFIGFDLIDLVEGQGPNRVYLGVGICLLAVPLILLLFRWIRGHFSRRLRD